MQGGPAHNLIAHLARRVLMPAGVRPRAPARFEPPYAGAPPTDFTLEDAIAAPAAPQTPRTPARAEPSRVDGYGPLPAEPPPRPERDEAAPAPRPEHAPPTIERREPGRVRVERTARYQIPPAPDAVSHRSPASGSENSESTPPPTPDPPREARHPPLEKAGPTISVPQQRELPTRVLERLQVRTERLVPPPAAVPTAPPRSAPAVSVPRRPDKPSAAPMVEIHIGRVEVRPPLPGAQAPAKDSEPPRRAGTQSLEEYLRSRTRERRGGP